MKNFNPTPTQMPAVLDAIQDKAGYHFKNINYLLTALTHSSYAAESPHPIEYNERLEFLGDAVLELIISQALYLTYPAEQEGKLSVSRALLVNEEATSSYAVKLGLDAALLLGKGGQINGDRKRKSIVGDAFEAFLGAVYLDGGLVPAVEIMQRMITNMDEELQKLSREDNPKGQLQDYCQRMQSHQKPQYVVVETTGPEHAPQFVVELLIDGKPICHGTGTSKRNAEQAAAQTALAILPKES